MRDILLVLIVLICCFQAIGKPFFGILAFIAFGLFNPNSITWGFGRTFPSAQLVAIATIIGTLASTDPKRIPWRRETKLLVALWLFFAVTSFFAFEPDRAWDRLIHISKILLMVFVSIYLITTRKQLSMLILVIALSLGAYGLKAGIFAVTTGGAFMIHGPENSFLSSNNSIGLALAMNVPLLYYAGTMTSNGWLRWLLRFMLFFSYPAVICTYSRGAWLGLGTATLLLILRGRHKIFAITLLLVAGIAVVTYAPERLVNRYGDLVNAQETGSAITRYWSWEMAWKVAQDNPVFGAGFSYYGLAVYEKYVPEFVELFPGKMWHCHSTWFTVLSEHGFTGLALWVLLLGSSLASLRRLRIRAKRDPTLAEFIPYTQALAISFVAFMVVGTFLDAAYFDLYYQLVAAVILVTSIAGTVDRSAAVEADAEDEDDASSMASSPDFSPEPELVSK